MEKPTKPKKRRVFIIALIVICVFTAAAGVIRSGILTTPTEQSLAKLTEVPAYDILSWQFARENEILENYAAGTYTIDAPFVIVDPYEMNPCSALVLFDTDQPSDIRVTIAGKDDSSTITYTKTGSGTHVEVPIVGLYAGTKNDVRLEDASGHQANITIETEALPVDFQQYELVQSIPARMEPGFTLCVACFEHSYTALIDCNADVRGYLSNQYMAHGTSVIQLQNGDMLATGDEYKQEPYNMTSLWEFNWLGKVFREYEVPNAVHHDISELPNGDILAVSNNVNMFATGTREDVAIILDRETGDVIRTFDFRKILDETRTPFNHFHPNIVNALNVDWMHMNAAVYDADNNSLIVSSPIQSMVVSLSLEKGEINWILGPHEGYEGTSAYLANYLLTPVGDNFEWQWCQHAPSILPDTDHDPNTIDLILLDNGQNRSFDEATALDAKDNYSRGVCYRIHQKEKTVEQLWEYGRERGSDCYATFLGDADLLSKTQNRLLCFGGQLRSNGEPVDTIVAGVFGGLVVNSRIVEVTADQQVVFEVAAHENAYSSSAETYQAERLTLYSDPSFAYQLGQVQGIRLGTNDNNELDDTVQAPLVYGGGISVSFHRICNENGRLIIDGTLTKQGKSYLLGRAAIILKSTDQTYVFETYTAMNCRFFASIDLTQLEPGTYQISVAGAIREGNDTQSGRLHKGHMRTDYKITVA